MTTMTILLIILGVLCLLTGLIGCFVPVLPGPPISYVGLLLLHFTKEYDYSLTLLLVLLALVIIVTVLDFVIPMLGSKYVGASKWGSIGGFIGTIVGLFYVSFSMGLSLIVAPFLGAFLGEKASGKSWHDALVAGFGSFLGFVVGTLLKTILCLYMIYEFVAAFF